jgi:hypothetical protein
MQRSGLIDELNAAGVAYVSSFSFAGLHLLDSTAPFALAWRVRVTPIQVDLAERN